MVKKSPNSLSPNKQLTEPVWVNPLKEQADIVTFKI